MTKHDLKELAAMGAELGAAKAEVERLREALQAMLDECDPMTLNCGEPWCRARAALLPRSEPCGGCGNDDESKRCIGCGHQFTPAPTDTFTAVDMATAAAQGFRDGQAAMEPAPAQDEPQSLNAWFLSLEPGRQAALREDKWMLANAAFEAGRATRPAHTEQQPISRDTIRAVFMRNGFTVKEGQADLKPYVYAAAEELLRLNAAPIAQTAPQGKFRMGDMVKKTSGSEWVGRVVGWYSTEQTKEGYAVESSAHRNSVQIYPAKALEAVHD